MRHFLNSLFRQRYSAYHPVVVGLNLLLISRTMCFGPIQISSVCQSSPTVKRMDDRKGCSTLQVYILQSYVSIRKALLSSRPLDNFNCPNSTLLAHCNPSGSCTPGSQWPLTIFVDRRLHGMNFFLANRRCQIEFWFARSFFIVPFIFLVLAKTLAAPFLFWLFSTII